MDTLTWLFLGFVWTLISFWAGILVHWFASRKERRLLKLYRQQAQVLREWDKPIE